MGGQDYYEILQIHHSAEPFMVTSAYRRLTREYHPDVDPSPRAHERMILINEAYAVLSDPAQRKAYDQTRNKVSDGATSSGKQETSDQSASTRKDDHAFEAPKPPDPSDFGIAEDYLARAEEGASEWSTRRPRVAPWLQFALRLVSWFCGAGITFYRGVLDLPFTDKVLAWSWLAVPVLTECVLQATESINDSRSLKSHYNPKFNPNPTGYARFSQAFADHETQMSDVFVSRSGKYHTDPHCYGMMSSSQMLRWRAESRGAQACSRCGFYRCRAASLPPPFGPEARSTLGEAPKNFALHHKAWWKTATYAVAVCCAAFSLSSIDRPSASAQSQLVSYEVPMIQEDAVGRVAESAPATIDQETLTGSTDHDKSERLNGSSQRDVDVQPGPTQVRPRDSLQESTASPQEKVPMAAETPSSTGLSPVPKRPDYNSNDNRSRTPPAETDTLNSSLTDPAPEDSRRQPTRVSLAGEEHSRSLRERTANEIIALGEKADATEDYLTLSDRLVRIRKSKQLEVLGIKADWKSETFLEMSDREMRIRKAKQLKTLGYKADPLKQSYLEMADIEMRIRKANELKSKGIDADWTKHSWLELFEMERSARKP